MTNSPAQDDVSALLAAGIASALTQSDLVNRAQRLSEELMTIQRTNARLVGTAPYNAKMAELDSLIVQLQRAASQETADAE